MRNQFVRLGSCFGLVLFLVALGFAGQQPVPLPQSEAQRNAPSTPAPSSPGLTASTGVAVDPNKYVLGAEDVVHIRTWREPDFTFPVAIRPDGKITIPLVGDVQAAGLTPLDLTASLKEKIGKYINNPDITVTVMDIRSKKYYIDGEVNHPGTFFLVGPITVLEALSNAAGFREFANTSRIRILRGNQSLRFNYKEVSRGKHMEQNILVQNGDHIIVP